MRRSWVLVGAMAICACGGEEQTAEGARQAAIALLHDKKIDVNRVTPDYNTLRRAFIRCKNGDGKTDCALTENKPAWVFRATMKNPDTAIVSVEHYYMARWLCPTADTVMPPIQVISATRPRCDWPITTESGFMSGTATLHLPVDAEFALVVFQQPQILVQTNPLAKFKDCAINDLEFVFEDSRSHNVNST